VLLVALLLRVPVAAVVTLLPAARGAQWPQIARDVLDTAALVAAVVIAVRVLAGRVPAARELGLRAPGRAGSALPTGVLVIFTQLFAALWTIPFHLGPVQRNPLGALGDQHGALLVLSALVVTVFAPICEEVCFRGYIFTALRDLRGAWPAAVATGLLFAAVHAYSKPLALLVPLAVFGAAQCWLYQWSGSLYPCIAAHALTNAIGFSTLEHLHAWQRTTLMAVTLAALTAVLLIATSLRDTVDHEQPAIAIPRRNVPTT
jgi:membrane protease YdiL (CAAX protease family)